MLSILIPTYNYNAFPLVEELQNQAIEAGIAFEIIILDDGSTDEISLNENLKINTLENCSFEKNETNTGRAKFRNLLSKISKYNLLLFIDCDTFPKNKKFIALYVNGISVNNNIIFGGIAYKKTKPNQESLLRWKYGSSREEITVLERRKNPYKTTLVSNILIKKEVFDSVKFDERINQYGYEDLVFIQNLKTKDYPIYHIDNPIYHLNYETSIEFLEKTKKALESLKFIEETKILGTTETKIQKSYHFILKFKLNRIIIYLYRKFEFLAKKNLLSKKPSLLIFDLYKLAYFCVIKLK